MCGIIGGITQEAICNILLDGLKRLEYRGYDSSGMAVVDTEQKLQRLRHSGKVAVLEQDLQQQQLAGNIGIAHTRWATHGAPNKRNAHPHTSDHIAVVHNGIIENYQELQQSLLKLGYEFTSETDTETIAHLLHHHYQQQGQLLSALHLTVKELKGSFALAVISANEPQHLLATRHGSTLVLGLGQGASEVFISSDVQALQQIANQFMYLDEGDTVQLQAGGHCRRYNADQSLVELKFQPMDKHIGRVEKEPYNHFMEKEINEQPQVVAATLEGYLRADSLLPEAFGVQANELFKQVKSIQIIACGSSYYAALVARYWFESWAGIGCQVEIASEFLYRNNYVPEQCLFVVISQSGETADSLAALNKARGKGYLGTLAICNAPNSSLINAVDCYTLTRAGFEISVASTKAFVTQLTSLQMLVIAIGKYCHLTRDHEARLVKALHQLPHALSSVLEQQQQIKQLAAQFVEERNMLFLGRGVHYPIACEGALKMKEISYIHAEAYPSGELKHGPLALIDKNMPVIAVAPNDELLGKLTSNLLEVKARGGRLYAITDVNVGMGNMQALRLPSVAASITPIVYTLPLQLLAYNVAATLGNDIDQPRNLAKSVTVE